MNIDSRYVSLSILAGIVLLALGCAPTKDIQVYTVKKEKRVVSDRMLGGILFHNQQAWYFKVTGPMAEIDEQSETFQTFLGSLKFAPDATQPTWTLPAGWKVEEKQRTGRIATLLIPLASKEVELSITALPLPSGDEAGYLLANVNRWRDQLGEPPLTDDELSTLETITAGDLKIRFVSIAGQQKAGGAMPPFAS
jgi:hypothetical protein